MQSSALHEQTIRRAWWMWMCCDSRRLQSQTTHAQSVWMGEMACLTIKWRQQNIATSIAVDSVERHVYDGGNWLGVGWLVELSILAPSKVISGWLLTCDSVQSWWFDSAASSGNQAAGMTWYPPHSHYPDSELTMPCPILLGMGGRGVAEDALSE